MLGCAKADYMIQFEEVDRARLSCELSQSVSECKAKIFGVPDGVVGYGVKECDTDAEPAPRKRHIETQKVDRGENAPS
jgi:hypothetical protein